MALCPCGSGHEFQHCCGPIIEGNTQAPTAEKLMRARYSAYVTGAVDFIMDSHDPETRENVSEEATREWSQSAKWIGLDIRNVEKGGPKDHEGAVEFVASFEVEGKRVDHHELALFRRGAEGWRFVDGRVIPETFRRPTPKVGRNDPCPCGSGKKFKFCCGRSR